MSKRIYFTVSGSGYFPVDMLRYDCCWPASTDSAVAMFAQQLGKRDVALATEAGDPTTERWSSFGWQVDESTIREAKKR